MAQAIRHAARTRIGLHRRDAAPGRPLAASPLAAWPFLGPLRDCRQRCLYDDAAAPGSRGGPRRSLCCDECAVAARRAGPPAGDSRILSSPGDTSGLACDRPLSSCLCGPFCVAAGPPVHVCDIFPWPQPGHPWAGPGERDAYSSATTVTVSS